MEEKIKDVLSFLDETAEKIEQKEKERWSKTIEICIETRVKTISRQPTRWDRIKNKLYNDWAFSRILRQAQDPLWLILCGDWCNILVAANNSDTYKPYPPQEIRIISSYQELSATECIGLVEAYHKEQPISRVQWHLKLSDDIARLDIACPLALSSRLLPSWAL